MAFTFGGNNNTFTTGAFGSSPGTQAFGQANSQPQMESSTEPTTKPLDELKSSFARLLITGSYSDLTVTCGDDQYRVHRAIICPRSDFFRGACSGKFKEANTGEIDLPEDDGLAVRMMIHYFYYLDYQNPTAPTAGEQSIGSPNRQKSPEVSQTTSTASGGWPFSHTDDGNSPPAWPKKKAKLRVQGALTMGPKPPSNLNLHAKVYALGEKYGIEGLKAVAFRKFADELKNHWDSEDFLVAIREVYTSTPDHDRQMRDVVVATFGEHLSLLDDTSVQDVVKDLDLGFDILMHIKPRLKSSSQRPF